VTNIVRIFAYTPLTIGIVSSVYQAALAYLQNSWVSTYYTHAKSKGSQYIISMEIACDLAYVAVWGVLLAVILVSANSNVFFVVAFIIAAVAAWGCLLISRQNKNSEFVGN
jgi:ABC-type lipoprotein release transport system permease subunit